MKKIIILLSVLFIAKISTSQCTDLFFSEYVEGTSNNKLIEIYNPTSSPIDLSGYRVLRHNSAAVAATDSLNLSGMLASGDVYVIGNPFGGTPVTSVSDVTDDITFYGGDDALTLKKIASNVVIDKIGETNGVDPGGDWTVGNGATAEYTLVRKVGVNQGNTNWAVASTEWDVYAVDMLDSIGSHTMTPCGSTSVGDIDFSLNVSVFPNPTNDNVNVLLNEDINSFTVKLFNSVGKLLYTKNINSFYNTELDLPAVKGVYFINITTEFGNTKTLKVVKE